MTYIIRNRRGVELRRIEGMHEAWDAWSEHKPISATGDELVRLDPERGPVVLAYMGRVRLEERPWMRARKGWAA